MSVGSSPQEPKLRVVVVDDEAPARALLCEYLNGMPDVSIVGVCANGYEAVKAVSEKAPDVVLLDVQMPKLSGFEVVELLTEPRPAIVFVTAYDTYAIEAFAVHALDYLLKPVDPQRLTEAITRAGTAGAGAELSASSLRAVAQPAGHLDRILIRDAGQIQVIPTERLDYAESQGDYVIFVVGDARLRKQQTLKELADALDPQRFVRIHRSTVLQVDRLDRLELYAKDSRVAILRDGTRLPVSRAGYVRLRELL